MITLTTPLWLWSGENGSWHFLTIAGDEALEIGMEAAAFGLRRGFGSVRVEVTIQGVTWRTSVFRQKSGGYILPVKADVRRRTGIAQGDLVAVELVLV
jgi:hypothetical protein